MTLFRIESEIHHRGQLYPVRVPLFYVPALHEGDAEIAARTILVQSIPPRTPQPWFKITAIVSESFQRKILSV